VAARSGISARLAHDDELEQVVRLRWRWEREGGFASSGEDEFVASAVAWAQTNRATHLPHAAVDTDMTVVGMAWLALTPRVASVRSLDRWSGDLQSCYVVPELRNAGVGGLLVDAVLATARARGVEHVTVHASPESARMYERHGFRTSQRLLWADGALSEN
jgi:GNAT superfamily N-acetyltransferase